MTALVFALQPDQICVAMDTLVVGADNKKPMRFQRKFLSLPEKELLVAGTGHANLINGWFEYVSSLSDLGDIDDLDRFASSVLEASVTAAGGLGEITTTLYHFGYSKAETKYVGFAYRSTNGFQSERLQYALGVKPPVRVESSDNIEFPGFMIDIVLNQQREDQQLPLEQQVGIGGEIEFAVLSNRNTQIETVYRFETYESERRYISCHENA
jgi:hypothetical protein